jgi:membrane-associated phospholipid phosphatase
MARPASVLLLGGIVAALGLAMLVVNDASDVFDRAVIEAVRSPGADALLAFLGPLTELGSTGAVTVVALLAFAVGAAIGPWRHGLIGAVTIGLAALAVEVVKATVARDRPSILEPIIVEHGFSFPSGHATLSMVAYGVLGVLVSRSRLAPMARNVIAFALGVLVVLIGTSRVWLGVHFPTDVIAGWIAGGVVVLLYASLTRSVSREPAEAAADVDPAAPRSDPPAAG